MSSPTDDPFATRNETDLPTPFEGGGGPAPDSFATHGAPAGDPEATTDDPDRTRAEVPGQPVPETPGGLAVPGYDILDVLGRGGMGVVYKARQKGLKRIVALKMIRNQALAGPADLARFRAEAEALASLQHPHIVQIYEIGDYEGQPYFSLEFVAGGSLDRRLAGAPQPGRDAARLTEVLARAMHAAHERGIVHRDLKPANVLLSLGGGFTRSEDHAGLPARFSEAGLSEVLPKITDFGLAKQLETTSGQTHTGAVMGTPSYMAPEQAAGRAKDVGPAADVYALGAILYELLTGRPPFRGATLFDTLEQVRQREPVPPSRLQPTVPRDLETVCLKCLQKEPARRYGSALALAEDLRRFANGEPIAARPTPAWERGLKWANRHRAAAALIVLSTATLLGALGGFAYHYGDVRRERDDARAEVERDRAELARAELRSEALQDNARGRAALDTDSIEQCRSAESLLSRSLTKVEQDPLLEDVCRSLARTLAAIRSRLTEDDARRRDARQLDEFRRLRDAAKFSASQSSGLNLVEGWKATRTAARNGLAVFGMGTGDRVAPTLAGRHLDQPETQEVRDGCYELLLILAHAVAEPVSGEETARAQAEQSLALLERAARVRGKPTAAYFLERAHCLHQMDDIEGERRELQRADSADAQAETGLDGFLIGNALYQRGNLAGAAKRFGGVVGVEPRNFWAHYLLAVCHLKSQPRELKLALARLDSCAGLKPDFAWTYLLRGFARSELGEFEAAAKDLDTAAKLLRPDEASGRYTLLVNRGVMRLRQTRTAEAVADFQAAVTLKPDEINARVNLAKAYQEQGRPAKAIREYERVIERQPKLAFLHASRARLLFEQKDLAGALAGFEQAIRVTEAGLPAGQKVPDGREEKEALAEYHSWRGVILYRTKQPKKALRAYAAALRLDPNYPVAQRERAFLLLDLKRYQEASQAFDEYLRKWRPRGPLAVEVYEARGRARMELGDFAAALEDQSGLVALDRHSARFAARGWLYVVSSAPVLALHDFEEAVKLDPANGDAYNGRGFARVKLGRYREAVEDAEEALRHGPRKARLVYNAARTYAQAAERAEHDPAAQRRYQDRALDLLRAALALTRAEDRPRFWWETVRQDAALVRLRRNTAFAQMGATYPKPMGKRER